MSYLSCMNYAALITEDLAVLQSTEKGQTDARFRDYVRFLRLLKAGEAKTQEQAARQVNLSLRQAQRVWKQYREQGLEDLLTPHTSTYIGKLSTTQMSHMRRFLLDDQAQTLADIQTYLQDRLNVSYTIGGIFDLCKRLKIKLKTGRPVHVHQPPGAVEEYKKNLRP